MTRQRCGQLREQRGPVVRVGGLEFQQALHDGFVVLLQQRGDVVSRGDSHASPSVVFP